MDRARARKALRAVKVEAEDKQIRLTPRKKEDVTVTTIRLRSSGLTGQMATGDASALKRSAGRLRPVGKVGALADHGVVSRGVTSPEPAGGRQAPLVSGGARRGRRGTEVNRRGESPERRRRRSVTRLLGGNGLTVEQRRTPPRGTLRGTTPDGMADVSMISQPRVRIAGSRGAPDVIMTTGA